MMQTEATIQTACEDLAPEDALDMAARSGQLSKEAREEVLARHRACVSATVKLARLLAQAEGDEGAIEPYLAPVRAWLDKPGAAAAEQVSAALLASDLVAKRLIPANPLAREGTPEATDRHVYHDDASSRLGKVTIYAMRSVSRKAPSDAAGDLCGAARTTALRLEELNGKPSGWAHARVIGIVQSEAL